MRTRPENQPPSPEDLRCIDAYLNGTLSQEEFAAFEQRLLGSAAYRFVLRQTLAVDAFLHERAGESDMPSLVTVSADAPPVVVPASKMPQSRALSIWAPALTVMVLVALGVAWRGTIGKKWSSAPLARGVAERPIATLVAVSPDARFAIPRRVTGSVGVELGKEWLDLTQGNARILFQSGASVDLQAPALLGIDSPMRCFLEYGRVSVTAPESARDFMVATEAVEVVDLGTQFEVTLDRTSGMADVTVTEGLVDLRLGSPGVARVVQPVMEGQVARIDAAGTLVELRTTQPVNAAAAKPPGLIAHLLLDEVESDGTVVDDSGCGHHGTVRPGGSAALMPGRTGSGFATAEAGWIELDAHAVKFRTLDCFTVACWIRNPREGIAVVFSASDGTALQRIQLQVHQGSLAYGWQVGSQFDAISGAVEGWRRDHWHHVAVAFDQGQVSLYRDGRLVGSGKYGRKLGLPARGPSDLKRVRNVQFGRLPDASPGQDEWPQQFGGDLDDLQIYSTALSAEAVNGLFNTPGNGMARLTQEN